MPFKNNSFRNNLVGSLAVWFLLAGLLGPRAASADNYVFIGEKQAVKEKNRWSLAEWLDQRDRMRMMDLWLALHSPSPYEFYLSGAYKTGKLGAGGYYGGWDVSLAAYAFLFGLEVQRQMSTFESRWLGLV